MRFQPGQSGNPAGRPVGSLNKKTLAAQAMLAERAEEIVTNLMDRAMDGHGTAMRLCMDRLAPTGRNRPVTIELPAVNTPEDAELALSVVTDELAAGKLTLSEFSALITAIERMLRLADRIWKSKRARHEATAHAQELTAADAPALQAADAMAPQAPEKPVAPLYSPVNSTIAADAERPAAALKRDTPQPEPSGQKAASPLPRAA